MFTCQSASTEFVIWGACGYGVWVKRVGKPIRRQSLYPLFVWPIWSFGGYGGDEGIRTLDGLMTHTPLAGERLQPLGHVSVGGTSEKSEV